MVGCEEMMIPLKFPVWLSRTVEVKQELEHKDGGHYKAKDARHFSQSGFSKAYPRVALSVPGN